VPTPDVLADLIAQRTPGQLIIGFAAETGDTQGGPLIHGQVKARAKGADLTVVNDVSDGHAFGQEDNAVWIVDDAGQVVGEAAGTKRMVADAILALAVARLHASDLTVHPPQSNPRQ
jgi:phosphopantothenoylcysteine decarboxylase/phosphopantothenate--cysteine ligase